MGQGNGVDDEQLALRLNTVTGVSTAWGGLQALLSARGLPLHPAIKAAGRSMIMAMRDEVRCAGRQYGIRSAAQRGRWRAACYVLVPRELLKAVVCGRQAWPTHRSLGGITAWGH